MALASARQQALDNLTLLLIYMSSWKEPGYDEDYGKIDVHHAWIGYDFDVLDRLTGKGLINSRRGRKSVLITGKGLEKAKRIAKRYGVELHEKEG